MRTPGPVLRRLGGVAVTGAGLALLVLATGPTAVVATLAAAGVMLAGPVWATRGGRLSVAVGGAVLATGAVALVWRDASVRTLAVVLAVALVGHGVSLALGRAEDRTDRVARVLLGSTSVLLGLFVLAWPVLSLHLVAIGVGAWLVLVGLSTMLRGTGPGPRASGRRRLLPSIASVLVAALLLAGTVWVHAGDPRIVPDAFYTPPASVPDGPGHLIRVRPLQTGLGEGLQAWLMLYTTTDGDGAPAVASGTVLAPTERPDGPLPVIAVAHGTTGVVPRCAPSLSATPFADGAAAALEQAVRDGHVAVMSDYVGLGTAGPHAYLVGPDAAHAVLDAVRAARELDDVAVGDRVVAWGHSQGGHAVPWTAILAADYAPELELLGVAALAPASDLYALADDLRTEAIGKLVAAYIAASWDRAYPELGVRGQLTPTYRRVVDGIAERCFTGRDVLAALATATQLSREVFAPGALDGAIGQRLRENSPTGPIRVPVLLAQGDADPLVLPAQQARYVAERCAEGAPLDARVYPGLDHLTLVAADSPLDADLLTWTQDRFAGVTSVTSCPG